MYHSSHHEVPSVNKQLACVVFSAFWAKRKLGLVMAVSWSARTLGRHQKHGVVWKQDIQFGADRGGYIKLRECSAVNLDAPSQGRNVRLGSFGKGSLSIMTQFDFASHLASTEAHQTTAFQSTTMPPPSN